jgi:phosphoglycolate phosphatase
MPPILVFDLDGTLVDSVPDLTAAVNRVPALVGAHFAEAEIAAMVGDGIETLLRRAFLARNLAFDPAALPNFAADYAAHAADLTRPFPGVVPTLQHLESLGWRMAVCTNKPEGAARNLLAGLHLDKFFAAVGGGDSFPTKKPDPAHVLATLAAAGADAADAIMLGDNAHDITAAHGAGVKCIYAAWGYGTEAMGRAADAVATTITHVPAIAARLQ